MASHKDLVMAEMAEIAEEMGIDLATTDTKERAALIVEGNNKMPHTSLPWLAEMLGFRYNQNAISNERFLKSSK